MTVAVFVLCSLLVVSFPLALWIDFVSQDRRADAEARLTS